MSPRRRGPSARRRTALGRGQHGITCALTDSCSTVLERRSRQPFCSGNSPWTALYLWRWPYGRPIREEVCRRHDATRATTQGGTDGGGEPVVGGAPDGLRPHQSAGDVDHVHTGTHEMARSKHVPPWSCHACSCGRGRAAPWSASWSGLSWPGLRQSSPFLSATGRWSIGSLLAAERYNCPRTPPTSSTYRGSLDQVDDTLVEPGRVVEVGTDVPVTPAPPPSPARCAVTPPNTNTPSPVLSPSTCAPRSAPDDTAVRFRVHSRIAPARRRES